MKKLILVIALGVSVVGFGQAVSTGVYAVGADEVSWVLQRGTGERIVCEYRLESTVGRGSDKIIAAIKTQMKNHDYDKMLLLPYIVDLEYKIDLKRRD